MLMVQKKNKWRKTKRNIEWRQRDFIVTKIQLFMMIGLAYRQQNIVICMLYCRV